MASPGPRIARDELASAKAQWRVIVTSQADNYSENARALTALCLDYHFPIYCYIRRSGHSADAALHLTRDFIGHIPAPLIRSNSPDRFRSFLFTSLREWLSKEWMRSRRQKLRPQLALDLRALESYYAFLGPAHSSAEECYEVAWAFTMLSRAMAQLEVELGNQQKLEVFEWIKPMLTGRAGAPAYADLANSLGISESILKLAIHRLRKRYGIFLRAEVSRTMGRMEDSDEEMENLWEHCRGKQQAPSNDPQNSACPLCASTLTIPTLSRNCPACLMRLGRDLNDPVQPNDPPPKWPEFLPEIPKNSPDQPGILTGRKPASSSPSSSSGKKKRIFSSAKRGQLLPATLGLAFLLWLTLILLQPNKDPVVVSQQDLASERALYFAKINLCEQAWQNNDFYRLKSLLVETASFPEKGFEWHYWMRQCHLDTKTVPWNRRSGPLRFDRNAACFISVENHDLVWRKASDLSSTRTFNPGSGLEDFQISLDGHRLFTAHTNGMVRIWEVATEKVLHEFPKVSGNPRLALSKDGSRLAVAGVDCRIFNLATKRETLTFAKHRGPIAAVAFAPDGKSVATAAADQTLRTWDAKSGNPIAIIQRQGLAPPLAFLPDGTRLAAPEGAVLKLYSVRTGTLVSSLRGHTGRITDIEISPNGKHMLTASEDRTAIVWDIATLAIIRTFRGHADGIDAAVYSSDSDSVVTAARDGTLKLWDSLHDPAVKLFDLPSTVTSASFNPQSDQILTLGSDGTSRTWKQGDLKPDLVFRNHAVAAQIGVYSSDGNFLLTGAADGSIVLSDALTSRRVASWSIGSPIRALCLSETIQAETIQAVGQDGKCFSWDRSGVVPSSNQIEHAPISLSGFSKDGSKLATAKDLTVKIWDWKSGRSLNEINLQAVPNAISFSPDSSSVLAAGNGFAQMWDAASPRQKLTLEREASPFLTAAFSSDGMRLATGHQDGKIRIWTTQTGLKLLALAGHKEGIRSVSFAPSGRRILSVSNDGVVRVWETE